MEMTFDYILLRISGSTLKPKHEPGTDRFIQNRYFSLKVTSEERAKAIDDSRTLTGQLFAISLFAIIELHIQGRQADLLSPSPDSQPEFHQYSCPKPVNPAWCQPGSVIHRLLVYRGKYPAFL